MAWGVWVVLALSIGVVFAEGDVAELGDSDFDDVLANNEFVLVEFFAPWCGHCKKLAPEYAKAATILKEEGVKLASVDATVYGDLASRFDVKGYPTLKWFRKGQASEYTGGRTSDTIVAWARKKSGPAAKTLANEAAIRAFGESSKVAVVGFFAAAEGAEYDAFIATATKDDAQAYGFTTDAAAAAAFGATVPGAVVLKQFDEGVAVFTGAVTEAALTDFVAAESVPLVIPFTMEAAGQIFQSRAGQIAFLFSKTDMPEFREVAKKYKGKFIFSTTDGSVTRLNQHVGIEEADMPKFTVIKTSGQMLKFPLDTAALTADAISAHLDTVLSGAAKPWFKSEKPPTPNDGPVKVIVGTTFQSIVLDPTKNVLLEIYAPWCGHCKSLEPIYNQLGEAYAGSDNVIIAKMDGTANEVDGVSIRGFPTLKFYPAGSKTAAGEDYQGGRTLEDFQEFLSSRVGGSGEIKDEL